MSTDRVSNGAHRENEIAELTAQVKALEKRASQFESWIKAGAIVAVVFGLGGTFIGTQLRDMASRATAIREELGSVQEQFREQADAAVAAAASEYRQTEFSRWTEDFEAEFNDTSAVLKRHLLYIYQSAADPGTPPTSDGANGWWQSALISKFPEVVREVAQLPQ